MRRISTYSEYELAEEFVNNLHNIIKEDKNDNDIKKHLKDLKDDLKLNISLVGTFGSGIGAFLPIVSKLVESMDISSEMTTDKALLLTVCALTIIYLEECKDRKERESLSKDSKNLLTELKLRGFGNGIVIKLTNILKLIYNFIKKIGNHIGSVINGFIDMFAYASLLVPIMNGLYWFIDKYDLTFDNFKTNLLSLGIGVGSLIMKHGVPYILKKLNISKGEQEDIINDLEKSALYKHDDLEVRLDDYENSKNHNRR
jgi:hypothetical protein